MQDFHGLHRAIHFDRLSVHFADALPKSWSKATCWEENRAAYDPVRNPALGNCLVSTLVAWADGGFDGDIVPCLARQPGNDAPDWHFQLERQGETIDPTAQQFRPGTTIEKLTPGSEDYRKIVQGSLTDEDAVTSLHARLGVLLENLAANGCRIGHSATTIIGCAQESLHETVPAASPVFQP